MANLKMNQCLLAAYCRLAMMTVGDNTATPLRGQAPTSYPIKVRLLASNSR